MLTLAVTIKSTSRLNVSSVAPLCHSVALGAEKEKQGLFPVNAQLTPSKYYQCLRSRSDNSAPWRCPHGHQGLPEGRAMEEGVATQRSRAMRCECFRVVDDTYSFKSRCVLNSNIRQLRNNMLFLESGVCEIIAHVCKRRLRICRPPVPPNSMLEFISRPKDVTSGRLFHSRLHSASAQSLQH